jgi:hypothetical protein
MTSPPALHRGLIMWPQTQDGEALAIRGLCHHAGMTFDQSWLNRSSAWWAKADRAHHHLRSLDRLVAEFRASEPYTVVPRPTDTPRRTEYRLYIHKPVPPEVSTTIGDILHNLRSALDSLAHEIAILGLDRPLTPKEERACVFPVRETPERFEQFFDKTSNHESDRIRSTLYGDTARAAFRSVQPFRIQEEAILLGVQVTDTYEQEYRWSELYRLTQLSNLDKHRRLTLMAWWPDLFYWMSNGPTTRRWLGGDGTFTNGSVLGYMVGKDTEVGDEVFHDFNLILADDPAHDASDPTSNTPDVVDMLNRWHQYITGWVFGRVFGAMSSDGTLT